MAAAAAYVAGICLQACLLSSQPATQGQSTMESSKRSTQHSQAVQVQAAWQAGMPTCSLLVPTSRTQGNTFIGWNPAAPTYKSSLPAEVTRDGFSCSA